MLVKLILFGLICTTWIFIILMGRWMPWASAVVILFVIMFGYMMMVTAAMVHHKRKQRKKPVEMDMTYLPKISVLVPAHNEEFVIEGTVQTLMALDYPDYEVLVIDDRSTDNTPQKLQKLVKEYGDRLRYHVRSVGSMPGKSAVLNEALGMTDGEVIAVFDADAYVEPDYLRRIVPFLAEDCVGGVQGRKVIANYTHNWLTRCQNYEYSMDSYFQCGRDTIRGAVEFRGNGQLVKRQALEDVGGWNELSLTDDLDLSTRFHLRGWDIRFAHKVLVWEEGIVRLPALLRQRRRWAEGSLTRYLEFAPRVFTRENVSLRTRADLIAYVIEFLFPIWMLSDYLYLSWHFLTGEVHKLHMLSSLFVLPVLAIFFYTMLLIAIIRFNRPAILHAIWGAMMTSFYLIIVWVPVAYWVTAKMLLQKERSMNWGKTDHGIAADG